MVHRLCGPQRHVHGYQWVLHLPWDLRLHLWWLVSPHHLHLKETHCFEGEGEEVVVVVHEMRSSQKRF